MKIYERPMVLKVDVMQSEAIADVPWGSFAPSLEDLGGTITSYDYGSGVVVGGEK